ncbi:MAG TPA: SDR family NAD(P)-dependent oxidoreductase, partial [Anaerolineae bacterium]|nr:SDR family NAD(P)-dependent oxidoreductase [Anaerolineae bacterium]
KLTVAGIECRRLHTSHAFHSRLMHPMLAGFQTAVANVPRHAPTLPFISNVTGAWITAAEAVDPAYWTSQLRSTVRFADGIALLLQDPAAMLIEVGPGRALTSLAKQQLDRDGQQVALATMPHPHEVVAEDVKLLRAFGRIWANGVSINWRNLTTENAEAAALTNLATSQPRNPRRIPLPTYPFETRRYWIDPPLLTTHRSLQVRQPIDNWFYAPTWQRCQLAQPETQKTGHTLLLTDQPELAAQLVTSLEAMGQQVVISAERDNFTALLTATAALDHIVCLWKPSATQPLQGFDSLLALGQALAQTERTQSLKLSVITPAVARVVGNETLHAVQATLHGAARVLAQEVPNLTVALVDVAELGGNLVWLAGVLSAEICQPNTVQRVAYRYPFRWVELIEQVALPASDKLPLKKAGVYLITGGLGGLGLTMATFLAEQGVGRVVLTTRKDFTMENAKSAEGARPTIYRDLNSPLFSDAQNAALRKIRELGCAVTVLRGDVTDRVAMAGVIGEIERDFGRIDGVIHAAGVAGGGLVQFKTRAAAHAVMQPKIRGTQILATLLADKPLDWLILFSSLTARLGGVGQFDYTAANAFMDSFAQASTLPFPVVSIAWDEWRAVGMAQNAEGLMQLWREQQQQYALTPAEGKLVFGRILAHLQPNISVATRDLPALQQENQRMTLPRIMAQLQRLQAQKATPAPIRNSNYAAPRNEIEQQIAQIWQEVLGISQVGVFDNFFDLGGNSLVGIKLIKRLNSQFSVDIPATSLYEQPTINKLTELLTQMQQGTQRDAADFSERLSRGERRRAKRRKRMRV